MFDHNPFENLSFHPRRPGLSTPMIFQLVGLGSFVLLWWLVPHSILMFLLLPAIAALIWVASFGWRQALARFIESLQTIEDRTFGGL